MTSSWAEGPIATGYGVNPRSTLLETPRFCFLGAGKRYGRGPKQCSPVKQTPGCNGSRCDARLSSAPGAEMIQQFSRGISVGRQTELDLHGADGIAGRGADHAIDLAHIEALLSEKLLQLLHVGEAQGLDRRIALAQRGRAGKTARVISGRGRI